MNESRLKQSSMNINITLISSHIYFSFQQFLFNIHKGFFLTEFYNCFCRTAASNFNCIYYIRVSFQSSSSLCNIDKIFPATESLLIRFKRYSIILEQTWHRYTIYFQEKQVPFCLYCLFSHWHSFINGIYSETCFFTFQFS